MRLWKPLALTLITLPLAVSAAGCAGQGAGDDGTGSTCTGSKCDDLDKPDSEVPASPCDGLMVNKSGRNHDKVAGRLHDPVAESVFQAGSDCPVTFQDIFDKMAAADTKSCSGSGDGAGMIGRAISETAQLMAMPTDYRLVASRVCDGRQNFGVLFSLFGVGASATSMPPNAEIIAFDPDAQVFNFYETNGRELHFFGNSKDMLKGPGLGSGGSQERRCANCHVGGGLVMKELHAPWVHWEGDTTTPGVADLFQHNSKFLGRQSNGIELESTVTAGNRAWNKTRLDTLKSVGDTKEILRPLFCTPEFNIGSHNGLSSISSTMLLDPIFSSFASVSIQKADYDDLIAKNGQEVGSTGKTDTFFPLTFPQRSTIDQDYVNQLISAGIIDQEFARDVALVNFTRPVFSDDRCSLLDMTPSIPVADLNPDSLKQGFLDALGTPEPGTAAAVFKQNLEATGGHDAVVKTFTDACAARPSKDFLADELAVVSLMRDTARERPIMEFPETMPEDNQNVAPGTRLDPVSCTVTTEFVPAATADSGDGGDGGGSPDAGL